jgi:Predicted membrane protein
MPLSNCPECGHDISTSAVACPNCGRPFQNNTVIPPRPVIVNELPREEGIPPWAFAAMGIAAIGLLILAYVVFVRTNEDTANSNLRVSVNRDLPARSGSRETSTTTVPSTSAPVVNDIPESRTTVPGSQTDVNLPPDKGVVSIAAKTVSQNGSPVAVKNEKFYLLDKSLEDILNDAGLEPIEGNSLASSLGLAVMFPDRYGDFRQKAMAAINSKVEYSGTTDGTGTAKLSGIEPGSYYLFGITKTGKGFAMWSSQVSVNAGDNLMNLEPVRVTEIAG